MTKTNTTCRAITLTALVAGCLFTSSFGDFADFLDPALIGTTEVEGWDDLNAANYGGYGGGFPGAAPWPSAIASNQSGSAGNASFNKVSGNAFTSGSSVYSPFSFTSYVVESTSSSSFDIDTVVFQIDMGPGEGGTAVFAGPTLNYNGGSQALAADFSNTATGYNPYTNPTNPTETGTTTVYRYQWDLSGISNVNDYAINWNVGSHSQIYEMRLDIGDTFVQAVPEPGSLLLLSSAVIGFGILYGRRNRSRK